MRFVDSAQAEQSERLTQRLRSLLVQLNALQREAEQAASPGVRAGLVALEMELRTLLEEVQSFEHDAELETLETLTLTEALSLLVEQTAERLGLASRVQVTGEEHPLDPGSEQLLYRIAREALYRVEKHQGVRRLRLLLNYGREALLMSIEDDGVGGPGLSAPPPFAPPSSLADSLLEALRRRMNELHGTLEITSTGDQGTRLQVRLPYTQAQAEERPATTAALEALSASASVLSSAPPGLRLLIVEGQAVTRAGLRRLLESYPDLQVVGEAADGVQGTGEALELGPQVVLLDMQLPGGQSLETLQQIKQLSPDTRVLALSTSEREEQLYEALRAGADGYVLKDIAPDDLAQAVRSVARGETLVQPQLAGQLLQRVGRQGRGLAPDALTAREQEVLRLLARGLRNKEIARQLQVSERTVNFHLVNIYQKLNVSGRTEALRKALEQGLL
jgi:DNA-binding NarL/FixJ family response regulator